MDDRPDLQKSTENSTLGLKTKSGQVRQNVARGRSRSVTVEFKRKPQFSQPKPNLSGVRGGGSPSTGDGALPARHSDHLTPAERAARKKALDASKTMARTVPRPSAVTPPLPGAMPGKTSSIESSPPKPVDGDGSSDSPAKPLSQAMRREDSPLRQKSGVYQPAPPVVTPPDFDKKTKHVKVSSAVKGSDDGGKVRRSRSVPKPSKMVKRGAGRRGGKLTIVQALGNEDDGGKVRSLAALRRAREKERQKLKDHRPAAQEKEVARDIVVPDTISVADLSNRMAVRSADVLKVLIQMGMMVNVNQQIDADTAELIIGEFGHRIKRVSDSDVEIGLGGDEDDPKALSVRPPIVVVMGHVDHGKTTLLDALRNSKVAASEAGGITQHVKAYAVNNDKVEGGFITFLDTPGHEAFHKIRERGAGITDIAVLVVASDDGVKPQTIEAINHIREAKIQLIVAVNKMDVAGADPDRIYTELLQHSIVVEKVGGDVLHVEISAKTGAGLDALLDAIALQSEILDLRGNPNRSASGTVIEARVQRGQGPVATVLIQRGTLRVGDIFVSGGQWGKVRALIDQSGQRVQESSLSIPIDVTGFSGAPEAGDDCIVTDSESKAREIARYRSRKSLSQSVVAPVSVEDMLRQAGEKAEKDLVFVIKADTRGSIDAIRSCLEGLSNDKVYVHIAGSGIGDVNESDVASAVTTKATILAFNVRSDKPSLNVARREKIGITSHKIIYDLVKDVQAQVNELTGADINYIVEGRANVQKIFNIGKLGKVAGCLITEGRMRLGDKVRVLRGDDTVFETIVVNIRREKDDVKEVAHGLECGISLGDRDCIEQDDVLESIILDKAVAP